MAFNNTIPPLVDDQVPGDGTGTPLNNEEIMTKRVMKVFENTLDNRDQINVLKIAVGDAVPTASFTGQTMTVDSTPTKIRDAADPETVVSISNNSDTASLWVNGSSNVGDGIGGGRIEPRDTVNFYTLSEIWVAAETGANVEITVFKGVPSAV